MSEMTSKILEALFSMMQQTHETLQNCKTDADRLANRARFEAFAEVQDMIREVEEKSSGEMR